MPSGVRVKPEPFGLRGKGSDLECGSTERDFLRTHARTPLSEVFVAAGLRFTIATNSESILQTARSCFTLTNSSPSDFDPIQIRIWMDPSAKSPSPLPRPYFRGLDHLVFMGFDAQSSFLLDLRTRQALGRVTPEIVADHRLWKTVIFPVILTTFAGNAGSPAVHAGCVAWKGSGLLLAGASGSGKSTLSLALTQKGFGFLSDDRTILTLQKGRLTAAGFSPYLKLRAEALAHFPALNVIRHDNPLSQANAIYINPGEELNVERTRHCEPRVIIWLEQTKDQEFSIEELSFGEIASELSTGLTQETPEAVQAQEQAISGLANCECFILRHGGAPQKTANELYNFLTPRLERRHAVERIASDFVTRAAHRIDPLRRFTPTIHSADFRVMRRHIRVESNCPRTLEYSRQAFTGYPTATSTLPDFVWRIIKDSQSPLTLPWPDMNAFSNHSHRFVNIGQKSFIAVDLECREAVAHVSEGLIKDEIGFASIVLASMFYLCAGALGLTAISSACVASDGKGLLLFGASRSGKTTSCFVARGRGYEFHADQAVFLEMEESKLKAWGDFWPAAFHAEASKFVPELAEFGRPFVHRASSYLCAEKNSSPYVVATSVLPVACIFLERGKADPPKLNPVSERDFACLLDQAIPFTDLSISNEARRAVRQSLLKLPAFRLQYDQLPSTPASFFRCLLSTHQVVECLG